MYANLTYTTIDASRLDEAIAHIPEAKAMLAGLNGFVSATWYGAIDGGGVMISWWETEANALEAAVPVGFSPGPGVVVERAETREILDHT